MKQYVDTALYKMLMPVFCNRKSLEYKKTKKFKHSS